jgi:hypothetical protein
MKRQLSVSLEEFEKIIEEENDKINLTKEKNETTNKIMKEIIDKREAFVNEIYKKVLNLLDENNVELYDSYFICSLIKFEIMKHSISLEKNLSLFNKLDKDLFIKIEKHKFEFKDIRYKEAMEKNKNAFQ